MAAVRKHEPSAVIPVCRVSSLALCLVLFCTLFLSGCSCSKDDPGFEVLQNVFDPNRKNRQDTDPFSEEDPRDVPEQEEDKEPISPDTEPSDPAAPEVDDDPELGKPAQGPAKKPADQNDSNAEDDDQQGDDKASEIDFGSIDIRSVKDPQQAAEIARQLLDQARALRDDGNANKALNKVVDVLDLVYPHSKKSSDCEQLRQEAQTLAQSLEGLINQPAPGPGIPIKIR